MKLTLIVLTALFSMSLAQAKSLNPCTPSVKAQPTIMNCGTAENSYAIEIDTMMSPATAECSGIHHYEYHTATVKVFDLSNQRLTNTLTIGNADFSYSLGSPGGDDGTFTSETFNLDLTKCISPMLGGFSIGNHAQ